MVAHILASLMAATAPVAPAPPPPPPPSVPSPPSVIAPPVVAPSRGGLSSRPGVTQSIGVQLRQDGHLLWSGEMARSSVASATYNQQLRESRACPSADSRSHGSRNDYEMTGLNVTIGPDYRGGTDDADADDRVQVSIDRTRPFGESQTCPGERGSSTVRFTAVTRLVPGQPVSLAGEGGVSVVLTLR